MINRWCGRQTHHRKVDVIQGLSSFNEGEVILFVIRVGVTKDDVKDDGRRFLFGQPFEKGYVNGPRPRIASPSLAGHFFEAIFVDIDYNDVGIGWMACRQSPQVPIKKLIFQPWDQTNTERCEQTQQPQCAGQQELDLCSRRLAHMAHIFR